MKLSFITTNPTIDILNWSGLEYYMAKTLEDHFDLNFVTGLKTDIVNLASLRKIFYRYTQGKTYSITRSPEVGKSYANQILKKIDKSTDVVFSPSSIPLAYLDINKPKVFYTDATFSSIANYYDVASNFCKKTIQEGLKMEKLALETCDLIMYASEWAAQSAINDFNINPEKIKIVPFGANLDSEFSYEQIKLFIKSRNNSVCKLAFIGVDWIRKGGHIVFDTVKELNLMGLPTEMHIVGLKELPEEVENSPFVVNHGFISKATAEGKNKFRDILSSSHFLFVPSKAEAYGLVFCEASAYGVPSISSKTGGITTAIKDDANGKTFNLGTKPELFAQYIYDTINNQKVYEELAESSYNEYKERLNWTVAGDIMRKHIKNLI